MALTPTEIIPLGFTAPHFELPNVVNGELESLPKLKGSKGTLVMFICNHCPFVVHVRKQLIHLANEFKSRGVNFIAISSNDIEKYPDDSPAKMKQLAEEMHFPFPYLYDESQQVARSYFAACTPDFNLFDENLTCVYRGRLDGSTPGNGVEVTGEDLRAAIVAMLDDGNVIKDQKPSFGCNIKWK